MNSPDRPPTKRRGRPPKPAADRFSEEFMMRLTPGLKAFVVSESKRRRTTFAGLIRTALGFMVQAAADRERLKKSYERDGHADRYEAHREYLRRQEWI